MKNNQKQVLCVGSAGRDIFMPTSGGVVASTDQSGIMTDEQWCFGFGMKIHVPDRYEAIGGCACNVGTGLSRLGVGAAAYGIVGDDGDGTWIREQVAVEGVDTAHLSVREGQKTDLSVVLVREETGERTILVNRDVSEHLVFDKSVFQQYDWIYLSSVYGVSIEKNMTELHDVIVSKGCKLAYNPGMRNILDNIRLVKDLLHHATLIFVNKVEAKCIVQKIDSQYNEKEAASEDYLVRTLAEHTDDRGVVVLTDGKRGSWVYAAGEVLHSDARKGTVVDTTGAGDAFASGFLAAYIHGKDLATSLAWGNANSYSVIAHYGAQKGLVTREAMDAQAQKFIQ